MENESEMQAPIVRPGVLKVFGILHIIFGVVGLIGALISLGMTFGQKAVFKATSSIMPEDIREEYVRLSLEYADRLQFSTYLSLAMSVVLTVLIIVAGVALLKTKRNAITKSNIYAGASILLKLVTMVLAVTIVGAATSDYYDAIAELQASAGMPTSAGSNNVQKIAGVVGQVITPLIAMIYPILSLVFLNRPKVKEFLAQHGK